MSNLQAIGPDGQSIIFLRASGTGTDLDPFVVRYAVEQIGTWTIDIPTGAATSANQSTIISHLDGLEGLLAGTLTVNTGLVQSVTDAQLRASPLAVTQSGSWTVSTGLSPLTDAQLRAQPVPVSISGSGDGATATNQTTIIGHVDGIEGLLAGTLTIQSSQIGALTETAPANDTASSGLNGRLQRIAQRITSLIALFPASLGVKTAANSLAVTLASDGVASGIAGQIGEVQASPTTNTVLDRLKAIATALSNVTLASESGFLTYRNTALSNTAVTVKGSAGSVMGWNVLNINTTAVYIKFYNSASPTVGTTTPLLTIGVPPGDGTTPGMVFLEPSLIPVEVFSTAISVACVTGMADNSTTAPATVIHFSARYK